jgi:5-methylthioribose kinase
MLDAWERVVWQDALGYAGAKATRRMVGFAHVSDIESLERPLRLRASRIILAIARELLVARGGLVGPTDLGALVDSSIATLR